MPETHYPEEVRFERDGHSIGVYVSEVWYDADADDETGSVRFTPMANVIINTDEQRPFTRDERDDWHDELTDYIREALRA